MSSILATSTPTGTSTPTTTSDVVSIESERAAQRSIAVLAAFLIGVAAVVHAGLTLGDIVAIVLLPLWVPVLRRFEGGRLLIALGVTVVAWGYVLSSNSAAEGFLVNGSGRLQAGVQLLGAVGSVGVLLWGRTAASFPALGTAMGLGMIVHAATTHAHAGDNAWKFVWAVPVGVFVLSLASLSRRASLGIVALLVLAVVSSAQSCRSYSAALVLVTLLLLWKARPSRLPSRRSFWVLTAGWIAALAGGLYYLGSSLLVAGYLGEAAQARTIAELRTSGSLILGGRPEISAFWALLKYRPGGYGVGVVPGPDDLTVAKAAMSGIGYDPNNGYVERFMFGGHIELHSVVGDLWANFGFLGLLFTAVIGYLVIRRISVGLSQRTGDALTFFLCVWMLWNIAFGPLSAALPILILTAAAVLPDRVGVQLPKQP